MSTQNECILCLDEKKNEQLVCNNRCTCKYYYHASCWSKMDKNKCVMCNIAYNNSTFLVDSPYRQASTQQVEIRIQIMPQQQQQQPQEKNECICIFSGCFCLTLIIGLVLGVFYLN